MIRLISLASVIVLLLPACSPSHPPAKVEPHDVEVFWFDWSADPPYGHEPILRVEKVQRTSGCPSDFGSPVRPPEPGSELSELILALQTEAAELGAEAVIETRLNCREGSLFGFVRGRYPAWVMSGLAVHWPDGASSRR